MKLTDTSHFVALIEVLKPYDLNAAWRAFSEIDTVSLPTVELSTTNAAVYSSEIEGESPENPESERRMLDLKDAYHFAGQSEMTEKNILAAHEILSQHLVSEDKQGVYRKTAMVIRSSRDIFYYAADAASADEVPVVMRRFFDELSQLQTGMKGILETPARVFYHAALVHLVFVNIHPFADGNGRLSRLIEKWYLASRLGERAWLVPSERYYIENMKSYFSNLRRLGEGYHALNYDLALPFLSMLPKSLFTYLDAR